MALRAAHDTAVHHRQPGRYLLPEADGGRCQGMTGSPFWTDVCHLDPLRPGDISVTNDLQRRTGQGRYGPDLHFLVELRGFEPLTPSMRKAYCAFGYHW